MVLDGLIIGVEGRFKQQNRSDASGHVTDFAHFLLGQRRTENRLLPAG